MAYASPGFWQPAVLNSPSVDYPALPFPNGQPAKTISPVTRAAIAARYRQAPSSGMDASNVFGVKTGDWGGSGPFGVKTGDFGNPSPNTPDIQWKTHTVGGRSGGGAPAMAMAGGSGGGGASAPPIGGNAGSLAAWYQDAMNRSNQANEARYRDVLGGYQSRYDRNMGMLSGLGQQEGRDINELYDQQQGKINQDLIGRGLGNSTVLSTMTMGNNRERNADLGRLNDRVRQQALTTDAGLSGDTLQFMERKTDKPPDVGLLAQLYQGMGQAGYGAGGLGAMMGGGYSPPDYSGGFNPYMYQQYPSYYGDSGGPTMAQIYSMARNAGLDTYDANAAYGYSGTGPSSGSANWGATRQPGMTFSGGLYPGMSPADAAFLASQGDPPNMDMTPHPLDSTAYSQMFPDASGYGYGYDPWYAGG